MMREHGVDAHPAAVRALVRARDGVPQLRRRSAVHAEVALATELDGGVTHVYANLLEPTSPHAPDGVRGARHGSDGYLRSRADAERRRQNGVAASECYVGKRPSGQVYLVPQVSEDIVCICH